MRHFSINARGFDSVRLPTLYQRHFGERPHYAYASYSIYGRNLQKRFWSDYFDVLPTTWHRRGESFGPKGEAFTPSGTRWGRFRHDMWSIGSEYFVRADDLDPHIAWIINLLRLPRADLSGLLKRLGATSRIFCYWYNESHTRVARVSYTLRAALSASGVPLEIDEYD